MARLFLGKKNGFYVDVGAHHPTMLSNTYLFYRKGWRGINIDAMPGSMRLFSRLRPGDVNIECGVTQSEGMCNFYIYDDQALNTFSLNALDSQRDGVGVVPTTHVEVCTYPLRDILDRHVPRNQVIDFMSVDVEGTDMDVLRSNDWVKYRPKVILAEDASIRSLLQLASSDIVGYMRENGYEPYCRTPLTLIFVERKAMEGESALALREIRKHLSA